MSENKQILIVDDEPDVLKMTEFRIRKAGYVTITAVTGQEGLDKARSEQPDLILLDYRLPVMNGVDVYNNLRISEDLQNIPVIFLTASRENEDLIKTLESIGAEHLLIKPYDPEVLLAKVKELLGES